LGAKRRSVVEKDLEQALASFFDSFSPTLQLTDELIRSKSHAQEILILLCSRLDALASSAAREDTPRVAAFTHFVTCYGRQRAFFESVSAGDLYFDLASHRFRLPAIIDKPGRPVRYSRDDIPMIELLWESGLPLTETDAERLLSQVIKGLQAKFRVIPGQPNSKPVRAKAASIAQTMVEAFRRSRMKEVADTISKALGPLLGANTLAAILYDDFRCEAIHSGGVYLDERKFLTEDRPYWLRGESEFFGRYLYVQFPAKFLARLLRDCINTYRSHLLSKRQLPARVFFRIFAEEALDKLELLDEDTVEEGHVLRPSRAGR
jgi:hypothetical protein